MSEFAESNTELIAQGRETLGKICQEGQPRLASGDSGAFEVTISEYADGIHISQLGFGQRDFFIGEEGEPRVECDTTDVLPKPLIPWLSELIAKTRFHLGGPDIVL